MCLYESSLDKKKMKDKNLPHSIPIDDRSESEFEFFIILGVFFLQRPTRTRCPDPVSSDRKVAADLALNEPHLSSSEIRRS